jgi:hypothetical protein
VVFLAAVLGLTCRTSREIVAVSPPLVGTLLVVGNEPFTQLSLHTDDRKTFIIQKDTTGVYRRAWKSQGQKLRIRFRLVTPSDSTHIILESIHRIDDEGLNQ